MLGGLGLQLSRMSDVGHEREVDEHAVATSGVDRELADGLQERERLDVANRPPDLGNDHVDGARLGHHPDAVLDLVSDVWNDLHRGSEVVAASLAPDHRVIDAAGGDVRRPGGVGIGVALVVTQVEVGFRPVLGYEDLAVLVRGHRSRVDVDVRVELLDPDGEAPAHEKPAYRRRGYPLPQRGDDSPGYEDVAGMTLAIRHWLLLSQLSLGDEVPECPRSAN